MAHATFVVGVGMTKFEKPGTTKTDYPAMVKQAVEGALCDCNIEFTALEQAFVGYVYGDSTCGQRALYEVGMTGIPIINVNNNCATGSTALFLAAQAIKSGAANCVLAVGFEKMDKGSLTSRFRDRVNPVDKHMRLLSDAYGIESAPMAAQMFGSAGREHMEKYGSTPRHLALIALKNHQHSLKNSKALHQGVCSTVEEIEESPVVYGPLTRYQCCSPSNGAAAAIIASEEFVRQHNLQEKAVEILGIEMATDLPSTFQDKSCIKMAGFDMTKLAAQKLFSKTGFSPSQVDVIELHDCFSANELITYEALGLCPIGQGATLVDSGDNTYGGKFVINPSGGLLAKGHPLGATGLAQCVELCWQLRQMSGEMQVKNARLCLQHNIGLGGAAVVALYRKGFSDNNVKPKHSKL